MITRDTAPPGASRWIVRPAPRPRARLRLFCLSYAGSGASVYRGWAEHLPEDVEVCAVQLPGRESRYGEPPFTAVEAVTPLLCEAMAPLLDRPFAFFGHSLGALIAYEAALALRERSLSPEILFASGRRAPQLPVDRAPIHHLPEPEFIDELRLLKGTPEDVFADPELLAIVLPLLRADFRMAETYTPSSLGPLSCPIVALGADGDDRARGSALEGWREVTTGPFEVRMFPGDHFYLKTHRAMLLDVVSAHLARLPR